AGTEAQRRDGNACAVHVGRDVLDETVHLHAGLACGQCQQRIGCGGTDAVQAYIGQTGADAGEDFADEPI
ncbi:hypothetical protein EY05_14895, partial [Staphylococcus aureus]